MTVEGRVARGWGEASGGLQLLTPPTAQLADYYRRDEALSHSSLASGVAYQCPCCMQMGAEMSCVERAGATFSYLRSERAAVHGLGNRNSSERSEFVRLSMLVPSGPQIFKHQKADTD